MPFLENAQLDSRAARLLRNLIHGYDSVYGLGSMSCAIYDTAWVAMVAKTVDGNVEWLFPSSFRYILESQLPHGGWETYASEIDCILNTMAALLALRSHAAHPHQLVEPTSIDMASRISQATSFLRNKLDEWDVESTHHVGHEILVPALLEMLEEDGITFDFHGRQLLIARRDEKLSRFHPKMFYKNVKTSALHSLEAFIGKVDFDRLSHHKTLGSMMASPSSTAAYLMHCNQWDNESEAYLRHVVSSGSGKGNGGVPSAFPSTHFEMIWMVSTLLEGGYTAETLGQDQLQMFARILEDAFRKGNGLIGFAPLVGSDADDTAKAMTALNTLGKVIRPDSMIAEYEAQDHFKTYLSESDASFSANCNILNALLHAPAGPDVYVTQIEKALRYLCSCWWRSNGKIVDKWNLSVYYPTMLMSRAFMQVLVAWDEGRLPSLPEQLLIDKVSIVLFQTLTRTMQTQNPDGSWGNSHSCEETSYAILTLSNLASLPCAESMLPWIESGIENGRTFVSENEGSLSKPEYLWIEKVTYGSESLSQAYILAALNVSPLNIHAFGAKTQDMFELPMKKISKFIQFYSQLPLFAGTPEWWIRAALIEGYLFLPQLRQMRLDIFPRADMAEDKYFEYIPFTWTASNNLEKAFFGADFLHDMMVISFLNYQADEYMEAVVGEKFGHRLDEVRDVIYRIFAAHKEKEELPDGSVTKKQKTANGVNGFKIRNSNASPLALDILDVYSTLSRFAHYVLHHPSIQNASPYDQILLASELQTFLLAHVQQISDNKIFTSSLSSDKTKIFSPESPTFFTWVRTTSSTHTSCPYSFAFATCLLSSKNSQQSYFPTPESKYISQAVCRHLATLCRMYNDHGSLARDRAEKNLNSVNFGEFHYLGKEGEETDDMSKDRLMRLATFERKCLELSVAELKTVSGEESAKFVRMFCNVTDTYGQIYVVKDIASRMAVGNGAKITGGIEGSRVEVSAKETRDANGVEATSGGDEIKATEGEGGQGGS